MAKLKNYKQIVVPQRHKKTGCIPTGIEWMVRYKASQTGEMNIPENDLNDFQEDFDLELNGTGNNWFSSIKKEVEKKHPEISLEIVEFNTGTEKYNYIEKLIEKGTSCIIPIRRTQYEDAHIVPVVEIDKTEVKVIWDADFNVGSKIKPISRGDLIRLHDGGIIGKAILILH